MVHEVTNEFVIELYCVPGTVEYLQNAFSSVLSDKDIFVVPAVCSQTGNQFERIDGVVSGVSCDALSSKYNNDEVEKTTLSTNHSVFSA